MFWWYVLYLSFEISDAPINRPIFCISYLMGNRPIQNNLLFAAYSLNNRYIGAPGEIHIKIIPTMDLSLRP